ncbi:hypothetical protein AALO_G00098520 [Alosa alosa]|uniref:Uncharacterized protein n=2 Tax=Alosa alosa TaxID=278164 RepID=A0AAV6GZE2_9TELE|nr:hypothetical protein AALO_G00098520 [Alosa alosa]
MSDECPKSLVKWPPSGGTCLKGLCSEENLALRLDFDIPLAERDFLEKRKAVVGHALQKLLGLSSPPQTDKGPAGGCGLLGGRDQGDDWHLWESEGLGLQTMGILDAVSYITSLGSHMGHVHALRYFRLVAKGHKCGHRAHEGSRSPTSISATWRTSPWKEVYVFEDEENPKAPIVVHFPMVNLTFREFKAPGVRREGAEELIQGDVDVNTEDSPYVTSNLAYQPEDFQKLMDLMHYNIPNNRDTFLSALRRALERERVHEDEDEDHSCPQMDPSLFSF